MILVFFVPAIIVSLGLMAWQLVSRRHQALADDGPGAPSPSPERLQAQQ
jgi:hypothetical protein